MTTVGALRELELLVASDRPEAEIQRHLEAHPWLLLPFPEVLITGPGGDPGWLPMGERFPAVISKLPLGRDFITDFAYVVESSGGTWLHLLEIEAPSLRVFDRKEEFTKAFRHAAQQLQDWRMWCDRHQQQLTELAEHLVSAGLLHRSPPAVRVATTLIVGRRASILSSPLRRRRWEAEVNEVPLRHIRSWDGFLEDRPTKYYMHARPWEFVRCVRYQREQFADLKI